MTAYLIRRLLLAILALWIVTVIVFLLTRFIPGSTLDLMIAQMPPEAVGEMNVDAIKHTLGLDVPVYVQYGRWFGVVPQEDGVIRGLLEGDLGASLWTKEPVTEEVVTRMPISFELGLLAIFFGLLIALPIGVYSAMRQDAWGDYVARSIAIILISVPGFWVATIVIVYPAIWWNWTPSLTYIPFTHNPLGNLGQFVLPAFLMGMASSGATMRITRTMMLEVLRQDYIRTAWAKGLNEGTVITRHALKNALIPVVTIVGMQVPILIGGSIIIEQIFSLPGVGRFLLQSLNSRDYPVISGINVIEAGLVLVTNIVVDVVYGWLDPRVVFK